MVVVVHPLTQHLGRTSCYSAVQPPLDDHRVEARSGIISSDVSADGDLSGVCIALYNCDLAARRERQPAEMWLTPHARDAWGAWLRDRGLIH